MSDAWVNFCLILFMLSYLAAGLSAFLLLKEVENRKDGSIFSKIASYNVRFFQGLIILMLISFFERHALLDISLDKRSDYGFAMTILTLAVACIIFAMTYRREIGFGLLLLLAGALMNFTVSFLNNGRMPVNVCGAIKSDIIIFDEKGGVFVNLKQILPDQIYKEIELAKNQCKDIDILLIDERHTVMTKNTKLKYLGDIFVIGTDTANMIASIGDFFLWLGALTSFFFALRLYRSKPAS